jgi:hypothetical protein
MNDKQQQRESENIPGLGSKRRMSDPRMSPRKEQRTVKNLTRRPREDEIKNIMTMTAAE